MLFNKKTNVYLLTAIAISCVALLISKFSSYSNFSEVESFVYSHYLFNYEIEFLKRGLIGETFRKTIGIPTVQEVASAAIIICLVFSIAIITISLILLKKNINHTGTWLFVFIFLFGSFSIQHFIYDLGRFDQIIYLLILLLFVLFEKNRLVYTLTVPVIILLMLLIHEAALFIAIPIIVGYMIYRRPCKKTINLSICILLFSITTTALITKHGGMHTLSYEEHNQQLSAHYEGYLDGVYVLHKDGFLQNIQRSINRLKTEKTLIFHIFLIALIAPIFYLILIFLLKERRFKNYKPKLFFITLSLSPLGLYLLGTDYYRWWSLALTNLFIAISFIAIFEKDFLNRLAEHFYRYQAFALVMLIQYIYIGPLGVFSLFPMVGW